MEYDSVPVLNKLLWEEKRLVKIIKQQRESASRLPYPKHSEAKIDSSHISGRLSGVEYAIELMLERHEVKKGYPEQTNDYTKSYIDGIYG
jgi:hypothetical protein